MPKQAATEIGNRNEVAALAAICVELHPFSPVSFATPVTNRLLIQAALNIRASSQYCGNRTD
ncbi:hypothetical protein BEI72_12650 [Erwinia amylovora]|nr:hypothetical protein BEI72_12650 [Erwinia amylovora]